MDLLKDLADKKTGSGFKSALEKSFKGFQPFKKIPFLN